jgi:hypothetical protein
MKNKKIEEIVLEYLAGTDLSARQTLKTKLMELGYKMQDLQELDKLYNDMDKIVVPEPGIRMTENFYTMLDNQTHQLVPVRNWFLRFIENVSGFNRKKPLIKFAYAFVLVFLGWCVGIWQSSGPSYDNELKTMANEIHEMKVLITLTQLNQSAPDEKLEGIHKAGALTDIDTEVILALLETLNNDPNTGVRLEVITVLEKFGNHPFVRQGLVKAITQQESPMVQLYLADIMVRLQEKNAVTHFRELLNRQNLNENVREKIEKSLLILI